MDQTRVLQEVRLSRALKAQESSALDQLYRDYKSVVSIGVRQLVHDPGMVEDLVQEVFLRAWRRASTLDEVRGSISTWLTTIAHNIAVDYLRSPEHRMFEFPLWEGSDAAVESFDAEANELARAVQSLGPQDRTLIELVYWEGLSHAEIARRFQVPLGSIKTWTRLALENLRELLTASSARTSGLLAQGPPKGGWIQPETIAERRISARKAILLLYDVVEHDPDAVVLADSAAHFILWNRAAEQLFGEAGGSKTEVGCSERYGLYLEDGVTPFPSKELPLWRAIQGEFVENVPVILRNATYESGVLLRASAKPRLSSGERLRGAILFCRRVSLEIRNPPLGTSNAKNSNREIAAGAGTVTIRESGVADSAASLADVMVMEVPASSGVRGLSKGHAITSWDDLTLLPGADPGPVLQRVVELTLELCQAGSAGISLLERGSNGEELFRWTVLAGKFAAYVGGTTPRAWSPCGVTLDRGTATLFRFPGRFFTYFQEAQPEIVEGLVIPFGNSDTVLGTLWIVSHDGDRLFDTEHVRVMRTVLDHATTLLAGLQSPH